MLSIGKHMLKDQVEGIRELYAKNLGVGIDPDKFRINLAVSEHRYDFADIPGSIPETVGSIQECLLSGSMLPILD